jgi:short-subunit dehydrogenase
VAGFLQAPFSVSYNATKAWLNSFTTGLHVELRSIHSPVRVQALCPGFTVTEFHDTLGMDRGTIPRSLWLSAEEVVDASLRGLERGKLFVVPGWRYRLFLAVAGILPQSFKRFLAIKFSRPFGKAQSSMSH